MQRFPRRFSEFNDRLDQIVGIGDFFPVQHQVLGDEQQNSAGFVLVVFVRDGVDVRGRDVPADAAHDLAADKADGFVEVAVEEIIPIIVKALINFPDVFGPAGLEDVEIRV